MFLASCKARSGSTDAGGPAYQPSPRPEVDGYQVTVTNLDAQIAEGSRRVAVGELSFAKGLPGLLLERASSLGTLEDYDTAEDVSRKNLAASPDDPELLLVRAHVLSGLHRFDEALTTLDAASARRAPAPDVALARATIFLATGRCTEAETLYPKTSYYDDLTMRASIEQRLGHADVAEALFERARLSYHDVSGLRLGWMDFERARASEREGDNGRARVWLVEALVVFPAYAHAVTHLEPIESPERALAQLEVVEKRATDPDVLAAHADALRRMKRDDEARAMTTRAHARFEELLTKHAEAFADHAARFFLGAGADLPRALTLARSAGLHAPTQETLELWVQAARALGNMGEVCAAVDAGAKGTCHLPAALTSACKR